MVCKLSTHISQVLLHILGLLLLVALPSQHGWYIPLIASKAAEDDISKLGPVLNKPFAVPALELSPFAGLESCCGVSSLDV